MKKATGINLKQFKKWILENVGKRCPEYGVGCFICDVYHAYDILESLMGFEKQQTH